MNAKRLLLVLAFGLFTASWAYAQTGNVAGTVTDAETGEVLPGVNVVIENTQRGTSTNADGDYRIANVEPGTYTLRASFVGYAETVVEDVDVQIDLTTEVDVAMQEQTAQLQEVVVRSETPVIQRDVSGTQRNVSAQEIEAGRYHNINNVIGSQVGVNSTRLHDDRPEMRGSGMSQQKFIVDGIEQGDPLTNRPHNRVNLDAVQEVKVQTGGFSARYGNARSGVVNVVLKEGREWTGSANLRYSPPGLKHFGPMMYGFDSPVVEPFVKEEHGAFTGNDFFEGWNAVANDRLNEGDPHYGNPDELYARWLWRHRSRDALNELQRLDEEGRVDIEWAEGVNPEEMDFHQYGVRPDYDLNLTLGGPIPATPLSFFGSYSGTQTEYARVFSGTPVYEDKQFRGKLSMDLAEGMKLRATGMWGTEQGGDGGQGPDMTDFVSSDPYRALGATNKMWYPHCAVPGQQTRQNYGLQLTHALSENTYYEAKFSHHRADYEMLQQYRDTAPIPGTGGVPTSGQDAGVFEGRIGTEEYANAMAEAGEEGWEDWRDWARIRIGDHWYDESPKGYGPVNWRDITGEYRMESCNLRSNETFTRRSQVDGMFSTQINTHNQISAGVDMSRGQVNQFYQAIDPSVNAGSITKSDNNYWMGALWAEDKLEYEGFIANLGLRLDFLRHGDFPVLDFGAGNAADGPYSEFLQPGNTIPEGSEEPNIQALIPTRSASHATLSPRLGISHPISTVAKVFFNYGHFYQWPNLFQAYRVEYDTRGGHRVDDLGNPNLKPPRTIQYELGYEHNLFNAASLSLTGYYKNVNNEVGDVTFHPLDAPSFNLYTNMVFEDIRGLEALLELRRETVPYVSGWFSANYWVESSAEFGLENFYEDPTRQPGLSNYEVSSPDVRPIIKGHINFATPSGFGPQVAGLNPLARWSLSLTHTWQRGEAFTWNPNDIPLVEDNVRWAPYQRTDMRLQKDVVEVGGVTTQFYLDVSNVFNTRNMTTPWDGRYRGYWAWDGHRWWNNEFQNYMYSLGYSPENQNEDGSFDAQNDPGDYEGGEADMPAFTPWSFLERRDVYFGFKVRF